MDETRFCSFCQQTFPDVAYLFRAPDRLAICDGCVELLADDLEAIKAEAAPPPPRAANGIPCGREPSAEVSH